MHAPALDAAAGHVIAGAHFVMPQKAAVLLGVDCSVGSRITPRATLDNPSTKARICSMR